MARLRSEAMIRGPEPVRTREALGEGDVADVVQAVLDAPVSAQRVGDLGGVGAFGGTAKGPDKALELAPTGDGQKVSPFCRLDPVGVRRALRHEQNVASPGPLLSAIDVEPQVSGEDLKDLILAVVHVKRRTIAQRGPVLQDGNVIGSVLVRHSDQHSRVQKPEVALIIGRDIYGHFGQPLT